ncbi:9955_t:CDS:2, partial [Scutellospora calospora]
MIDRSSWIKFFNENNIQEKDRNNWYFSGLTIRECKTAIENGWTNHKILNNCVKYRNFRKINILNVNKDELDTSLDILEDILDKNKNSFKSLPVNYEDAKINNLNDNLLPRGAKQIDLKKAIIDKRNTMRYKINEPNNEFNNDGLTPDKYQKILKSIDETQEIIFNKWKNKVTPEFLNKFLGTFLKRKGDENLTEKNLDKCGITGAEVLEEEKKLDKSLAGTYLLPYVFNLIDFDPDKLKNNDGTYNKDYFAKVKDVPGEGKILDVDGPGILPILTGGGKTTKLVRCLLTCVFPSKHIILITPNEELAADAENHHNTWLQYANGIPYKCVIHGKEGELPYIVKNETSGEDGKSTLSILQLHHLVRYIAYEKVKIKELKDTKNHYKNFDQVLIDIKEKLIDKENTIIIFDEAHFPNTSYQVVQPLVIRMEYNVLLMSATFPKKNFSISTSKPREVYSISKFDKEITIPQPTLPNQPKLPDKIIKTDWENEKTQIFFRTTANEYDRKATGEEDLTKPLLKSGLTLKQFEMLKKSDIPFVIFDSTNSSAVTGITEGMPPSSLFIANINHEMGFSPAIDNVILTGETQLKKLGKGPAAGRWIYDKPSTQFLSVASMIQQIGRVGRLTPGKAFLTTQKLKELKPPKDIIYHIISGIILPKSEKPMTELNRKGYPFAATTEDHEYQNLLWASIALPYKKNRPVEAVMIGMKGDPRGTISNREICPTYENEPDPN